MDYWTECISEALGEAGISASKEQVDVVAGWVEGAHENYGMAHGHHTIPNPLEGELREAKTGLDAEKRKVNCRECGGTGHIVSLGPYHSCESSCFRCNGEGRHLP